MPTIGEMLGERYRLDALIGSGGFAAVFRAHDLRLDRDVAVKVLLAGQAGDPAVAARFDREARVLAALSHPNVVAIHDVEPGDPAAGTEPFLVMDLCEGGSLADRLAAAPAGALPPDELVPILVDVAAGLTALHEQGVVHRDLKPSNILLGDGRARIADLGIAAIGPSELTVTGTTLGTLGFLAPEQIDGEPGSPSSDVYALGTIAFLGLTGTLPRALGSYAEMVSTSRQPVPPVSELRPALGTVFDAPVARALDLNPSTRPPASEFGGLLATALNRWQATPAAVAASQAVTVIVEPEPDSPPPAPPPAPVSAGGDPGRIRRLVAGIGIAIIALAVGLLGYQFFRSITADGSASPTPSASASAVASASSTVAASASPSATVDPFADARAASDGMRTAIADARGSHGLNGREARNLESVLDEFDQALDAGDPRTARDRAHELSAQVSDLIDQGSVDSQGAAELSSAANRLVEAANAIPE